VLRCKKRYAAAARFYADAFAADPKQADDLQQAYRYNAACFAALAAAGKGEDASQLDDKERARLRSQARDWLRADLAARTTQVNSLFPWVRDDAIKAVRHWREDSDLAGVRDADAIEKLPADERDAWKELWADVDRLLGDAKPSP
jgi:hypothetical protein